MQTRTLKNKFKIHVSIYLLNKHFNSRFGHRLTNKIIKMYFDPWVCPPIVHSNKISCVKMSTNDSYNPNIDQGKL